MSLFAAERDSTATTRTSGARAERAAPAGRPSRLRAAVSRRASGPGPTTPTDGSRAGSFELRVFTDIVCSNRNGVKLWVHQRRPQRLAADHIVTRRRNRQTFTGKLHYADAASAGSIQATASARASASADFSTTSTCGPSGWKLGYEPTVTIGQRSVASTRTPAILDSPVWYLRRQTPIGRSALNSSAWWSNISSISRGRPGSTQTFASCRPGAPPSGFTSGRLPTGSAAQRAAYSGAPLKR